MFSLNLSGLFFFYHLCVACYVGVAAISTSPHQGDLLRTLVPTWHIEVKDQNLILKEIKISKTRTKKTKSAKECRMHKENDECRTNNNST